IGGSLAFAAPRMSMGDCSLPVLHAANSFSRSPQLPGPCFPPYCQWAVASAKAYPAASIAIVASAARVVNRFMAASVGDPAATLQHRPRARKHPRVPVAEWLLGHATQARRGSLVQAGRQCPARG